MKDIFTIIFKPTSLKRFMFFCVSDVILVVASLLLSFLFHFDFNLNINYFDILTDVAVYFILAKTIAFVAFRIYRISWRYVSLNDLANIVIALVFSELLLVVASLPNSYLPPFAVTGFAKRIFFIDGIISVLLVGGLRISKRFYLEVIRKSGFTKKGKRTIILGAGGTGEMILRDMARLGYQQFYPVGLLDDDPLKVGTYMHNVKVHGRVNELNGFIMKYAVEAVIVAIPMLNHKLLKGIYEAAKRAGVKTVKIVPRIYDFDKPDVNLKALEDISVEDLLGRQVVPIDYSVIRELLKDKVVLITGAGGSIGSELVIQTCAFSPGRVILFDIDDTELHNMELRLKRHYPQLMDRIHLIVGDVRDKARVEETFAEFSPQVVFHAAAYKHVPMMEHNPTEAVKVNIFGTYTLAEVSQRFGVERFVMISTDKAVRPTSIMGATKRMAEYICQALNSSNGSNGLSGPSTRFISVRFGNVLGSRGSVIPLFLDQLKQGGPLTVTHRDMVRFFMTIPEAVSLILQASTMGEGGEVFVLDMGEPVRIVELAEELISIHGLEPYRDIDIEFTGIRPGEKIFEEILTAEEGTVASKHEKVFTARNNGRYALAQITTILREFENALAEPKRTDDGVIKDLLKRYVKHYEEERDLGG